MARVAVEGSPGNSCLGLAWGWGESWRGSVITWCERWGEEAEVAVGDPLFCTKPSLYILVETCYKWYIWAGEICRNGENKQRGDPMDHWSIPPSLLRLGCRPVIINIYFCLFFEQTSDPPVLSTSYSTTVSGSGTMSSSSSSSSPWWRSSSSSSWWPLISAFSLLSSSLLGEVCVSE